MTLHKTGYEHWDGRHRGIWARRAVIARHGLKSCLQVKWMRYLVTLSWSACLVQIGILFLLGQLLVKDSAVVRWLANLNPQLRAIGNALGGWLEQHPEISVRTTHNLLFYFFSNYLLVPTLIAIAIAIPHLISRDLSSNAIIVYSSKAVGRIDYLIGKFATVFGLMVLTWLGPVCVGWLVGNLLSTHWHFFWHSRMALGHALVFLLGSMMVLSILALGISAVSSKSRSTVSLWIALWILGNALVPIARQTKPWLQYLSFSFNLDQISLAIFQLRADFTLLDENLPFFSEVTRSMRRGSVSILREPEVNGALIGLAVMLVLSVVILVKKVKPE